MLFSSKFPILRLWTAVILATGAGVCSSLADDDKKDKKKVDPGKGVSSFGQFLPLNRENLGVTIPSFDGGVRTALVTAEKMKRVDDENLELENMKIEMFLPDGSTDSRIALKRAWFHMPTSILVSRTRSKIERKDFYIEGDSMVFDTATQRGRIAGNVEMIIFDVKNFGPAQAMNPEESAPDAVKKDTDGNE